MPIHLDEHSVPEAGTPQKQRWYLRKVPNSIVALASSPLILVALPIAAAICALPGFGFVYLLFPSSRFAPTGLHLALAVVLGGFCWAVFLRLAFLVSKSLAFMGIAKHGAPRSRPPEA